MMMKNILPGGMKADFERNHGGPPPHYGGYNGGYNYNPSPMYHGPPSGGHIYKHYSFSHATGSGGSKGTSSAALSALTLLSFLFFLNILQQCLKDQMTTMNPQVMIMTAGREEPESPPEAIEDKAGKSDMFLIEQPKESSPTKSTQRTNPNEASVQFKKYQLSRIARDVSFNTWRPNSSLYF